MVKIDWAADNRGINPITFSFLDLNDEEDVDGDDEDVVDEDDGDVVGDVVGDDDGDDDENIVVDDSLGWYHLHP